MFKQYKNFDIKKFTKTFNSNKDYNGDINGFDIMIMQSHESADKLIKEIKDKIDLYSNFPQQTISIDYNDDSLLESDKKRVRKEIQKYASQKLKSRY